MKQNLKHYVKPLEFDLSYNSDEFHEKLMKISRINFRDINVCLKVSLADIAGLQAIFKESSTLTSNFY